MPNTRPYDFCGWATRNDIRCADGRTIRKDAFIEDDGLEVPIVWQHQHNDPANVLGHALLENHPEGVYTYGWFNDTDSAKTAKSLVDHGDIKALSIYANKLQQSKNKEVLHGRIREVSLVLCGANPGAFIEFPIIAHSEDGEDTYSEEEATIYNDDGTLYLSDTTEQSVSEEVAHSDDEEEKEMPNAGGEKTVQDVFDSMTEEQKNVVYYMIGQALQDAGAAGGEAAQSDFEGDDEYMMHNVFEGDTPENTLTHDQIDSIFSYAKSHGSLKDAVLQHTAEYGIDQIDWLYPEDHNLNPTPEFIKRDTDWVAGVINGVHHTPFSRVKSMQADITADAARAKGYIKGHLKKEEVFTLLKRSTDPQTIYKKQKIDRDDILDITDFDVIAWIKGEMRIMLDEEIARAILIGDGRETDDEDHISELHVRSIWKDHELYSVKVEVPSVTGEERAKTFIKTVIKNRKKYKGSGNPTLYTTEDLLNEILLLEDGLGREMYESVESVCKKLRVRNIVTVEPMEQAGTRDATDPVTHVTKVMDLLALMVNLNDYNVGADKGGSINMFDDFDIDYNQMKYLIETRISGALVKPFSALVFEMEHPTEEADDE